MKPTVRLTNTEDSQLLSEMFYQPGTLRWFPMLLDREIEDSVRIWMRFAEMGGGVTAEIEGVPCGMAVLNLSPFKKTAHTCLISILVTEKYRDQGIGSELLSDLEKLAKEKFQIELLYLEVYEGNPAIRLYQRFGYEQFGIDEHFIKEDDEYISKILMQKKL